MTSEVEKLLSLIYQANGQIKVENQQLFVSPPEIAKHFGEQIKKLKPEILLAFGCCPICARELVSKIEDRERLSGEGKQTKHHLYCSGQEAGHYDEWKF